MVTDPQTNKHTHTDRDDYNTLRRSFANAQCNKCCKRDKKWTYYFYYFTESVDICIVCIHSDHCVKDERRRVVQLIRRRRSAPLGGATAAVHASSSIVTSLTVVASVVPPSQIEISSKSYTSPVHDVTAASPFNHICPGGPARGRPPNRQTTPTFSLIVT